MDYKNIYSRLVERARTRTLVGYSEKHHIRPRCLGGSDVKKNVVRLTPEEHYVAHQLLVKMYPGNHQLLWAAVAMTNNTKCMPRKNKLYGWLRRRLAEAVRKRQTGRHPSKETRQKMRESKLGVLRGPHTAATKRKMSQASKGKPKSKAHRRALSKAKIGFAAPRTARWLRNMSKGITAALAERDFSERRTKKYRANQSAQMKKIWAERRRNKNNGYVSEV